MLPHQSSFQRSYNLCHRAVDTGNHAGEFTALETDDVRVGGDIVVVGLGGRVGCLKSLQGAERGEGVT
jgi:hypothetical protein